MPASWAVANGHPDFAELWRDVTEPMTCDAAAAEGGGLLALWDRDIGDGLPSTGSPARGDIGVVEALGFEAGAIFTGERWAIQGPRTIHFLAPDQVRLLKAWRVTHG